MAPASGDAGGLVSVPALLDRNAKKFGTKAAYREKEFGIWQTWSWGETREEIRNLALGLLNLGVNKGDFVAIIGSNRPHLYLSLIHI